MSGRQCVTGERNIGVSLLLLLLIVSAGCRQNVRDAARRGDLKQIKTLSAIGAHISQGLHEAAANGHADVVRFILEKVTDPKRRTRFAQTALYPAATNGHVDVVRLLLKYEIDVNRCPYRGTETALHQAALKGHPDVIKILLENGADVNGEGEGAGTALLWAAFNGQIQATEMLLAYGADINDNNTLCKCGTALHAAVSHNQPEMVKYLLKKGAYVNPEIGLGCTPLHTAAWCDKVQIARILLANGADPAMLCDGRTALQIARSNEFRKAIKQQSEAP
jgi:ankyrin repeat protein